MTVCYSKSGRNLFKSPSIRKSGDNMLASRLITLMRTTWILQILLVALFAARLGLAAENAVTVDDVSIINTSFPEFLSLMRELGARIDS